MVCVKLMESAVHPPMTGVMICPNESANEYRPMRRLFSAFVLTFSTESVALVTRHVPKVIPIRLDNRISPHERPTKGRNATERVNIPRLSIVSEAELMNTRSSPDKGRTTAASIIFMPCRVPRKEIESPDLKAYIGKMTSDTMTTHAIVNPARSDTCHIQSLCLCIRILLRLLPVFSSGITSAWCLERDICSAMTMSMNTRNAKRQ